MIGKTFLVGDELVFIVKFEGACVLLVEVLADEELFMDEVLLLLFWAVELNVDNCAGLPRVSPPTAAADFTTVTFINTNSFL